MKTFRDMLGEATRFETENNVKHTDISKLKKGDKVLVKITDSIMSKGGKIGPDQKDDTPEMTFVKRMGKTFANKAQFKNWEGKLVTLENISGSALVIYKKS